MKFAKRTFIPTSLWLAAGLGFSLPAFAAELVPWPLPWDGGTPDSQSVLTGEGRESPAGRAGFIRAENGHFVDGNGKRLRLLGVNMAFSGNFPTHAQAEGVAGRMARFGINCVRFHHTDTLRAPNGLWKEGPAAKQELDPENLDRLDYFIHALKQRGIYADLNMKIGRKVVEADGFPQANLLPTYDKGIDHYYPRHIELQKQYARDLLTHKNPYTGNRYVEEPAIAIVELNNESGLVSQWSNGELDDLPDLYIQPLREYWNEFLRGKYQTTSALRIAWEPQNPGTEMEMLSAGLRGWSLQQTGTGQGTLRIVPEGPDKEQALKISVTGLGAESWHVQAIYRPLRVKEGGFYRFSFWIRGDAARSVTVALKEDHSPWSNLDNGRTVEVTGEWKRVELVFAANQTDPQARLDVTGLGGALGAVWIARPSLIDSSPAGLPENQTLENGSVDWLPKNAFGGRTMACRRDWIEFLVQQETKYYEEMLRYLKEDLGVRSLVAGTQLMFGTITSQLVMDFIDNHAYWQHPNFPGQPWDSENWVVNNISMVGAARNALERLMMARIAGRPYTVTEYNHPAPITFSSETIPLIAAYGALQDWDGIFIYSYSHDNQYARKSINHFFDIAGHSPKMMTFPAAAHMFLRGDVAAAIQIVQGSLSQADYLEKLIARNGSTWFVPLMDLPTSQNGVIDTSPYQHRVALEIGDASSPVVNPPVNRSRRMMTADTGELIWNQSPAEEAYVLIKSPKTKGFIGFPGDTEHDLGHGVTLRIGETRQNWANVLFTYLGTRESGEQWLLTATGYHENTGMVWKDAAKSSVGTRWGSGPPLVEPVPLRLTFTAPEAGPWDGLSAGDVKLYTLNERAKPDRPVADAVRSVTGGVAIDLMGRQPGLWYLVEFSPKADVMKFMGY
ncbi:MAG: carbohydrate binding domain-containing protein [bacterium]